MSYTTNPQFPTTSPPWAFLSLIWVFIIIFSFFRIDLGHSLHLEHFQPPQQASIQLFQQLSKPLPKPRPSNIAMPWRSAHPGQPSPPPPPWPVEQPWWYLRPRLFFRPRNFKIHNKLPQPRHFQCQQCQAMNLCLQLVIILWMGQVVVGLLLQPWSMAILIPWRPFMEEK